MEQSPCEADSFSASKKLSAPGTQSFITRFTTAQHIYLFWARSVQFTTTQDIQSTTAQHMSLSWARSVQFTTTQNIPVLS